MNTNMRSFMSQNSQSFLLTKSFTNNSPSKIHSTYVDKSKLSFYLKDNINLNDVTSIDLKGKGIQELDDIAEQYRDVENLILDNNQLEDIQGIQQFQNVKQLSLINNQIGDILNAYHLRGLAQVENLDLRGNPITTRPAYRYTVILFMKNLKVLDGKLVKASERLKIPAELNAQYTLLDRLLRNYVEILRLQSVAQRLDIFKEMMTCDKSYLMTYVPFDLDRLRRLYNYQDSINEKIRNGFRGDLLSDIRVIELEFLQKQDMPAAANELLLRQSKSITELNARIKTKFQAITTFHNENYPRFDAYEHVPEENVLPSTLYPKSPFRRSFRPSRRSASPTKFAPHQNLNASMTVNEIFNFQKNPFDSVNQSTLSLRSPIDNKLKKKSLMTSRPIHKSVAHDRLYSPQRNVNQSFVGPEHNIPKTKERALSPAQMDLLETYQRNLTTYKDGEQVKKGRPQSPQDLLNYVNATSHNGSPGRSRHLMNMSPKSVTYRMNRSEDGFYPGSGLVPEGAEFFEESVTKKEFRLREDQLNLLNKNLQQKVEELEEVDRSNKELKEKLKSLQKQNELELNLAQDNIEKVKKEAQIVENSRQQLEAEIRRMRKNILELTEANSELERKKIALREEREDLRKYEGELVEEQILANRAEDAYEWYLDNLKVRVFHYLSQATDKSRRIRELALKKQIREERDIVAQTFAMLKRSSIVAKIISYKKSRIYLRNLQTYFSEWRMYTDHQKMGKVVFKKKQKDQLAAAFENLRQYTEMRLLKKTVKAKVQGYYCEVLVKKGYSVLKRNFDLYGLNNRAEDKLNRRAYAKNDDWIKRTSFLKWHKWVKEVGIPKRIATSAAHEHYQISLQKLGLTFLGANYALYRELYKKADMLSIGREMRTIENVFLYWKKDFLQQRNKKRLDIKRAQQFVLRKKLDVWKSEYEFAQKAAEETKKAQNLYEINSKKKVLLIFLDIWEKGKATGKLERAFHRKNNNFILKSFYQGWRKLYQKKLEEKRREKFEGMEALGLAFNTWIKYLNQCKEKNRKLALARRQGNNTMEKLSRKTMKIWKKFTDKAQRRDQIAKLIGEKRKKRIFRFVFVLLADQRVEGIKINFGKLDEEQDEVSKRMKESEEQINEVSKKRSELSERLYEINDHVEIQRDELSRKNKEIERYEDIIREKERKQNKLEEEFKNKNHRFVELEAQHTEVSKKLEKRTQDDTRAQENMKEEREQLKTAIEQTIAETNEKDTALKEIEEEIETLREKKETYLSESNQVIEDLKKELRMINEAMTNKDSDVRRAVELVKVLEKRNQELRVQLHGTVIELERNTLENRTRAKELEEKNEELVFETNKLKVESERRSKEILELGGTARRYEYELEFMRNGTEQRLFPRSKSPLTAILERSIDKNLLYQDKEENRKTEEASNEPKEELEIRNLKDYLVEKRRKLDRLDEKQDEIWRDQGSKDKIDEKDIQEENEEVQAEIVPPRHMESFEESNLRGLNDSKRKIEEIRKKLEGVKRESRILDDSIQKDSFTSN